MKKLISLLLALLGLNTACGSKAYEDADVATFDALIKQNDVQLLDVRTPQEFAQGHLDGAINIDVKDDAFMQHATARLDTTRRVAVYCRSGRRSADAARMLSEAGYKVVNLKGGIMEWQNREMSVTTVAHEMDAFTTPNGKTVKFYALMHGSIRICYDNLEIEVDPVSRLGEREVDFAALGKADYILVTHEHADHFDKAAINMLTKESTRLVTNSRCADMLGYGQAMANGDHLQLRDDITIDAVPAYNTTEGHLQFHPRGRDNGFVLTLDGLRIYIAGDTEDIPEMATLAHIDIAFLPCNQPYTMTPDQLIRAARMVKPRVLFPYHYGQTDVTALPAALRADGIDVRIRHYE